MGKRPSLQMYPGDWLRDQVSGCSIAAQGLWWRIMMIMHDCPRYGYLCTLNGTPIPPANVAQMCGVTLEQYVTLLQELDSVNVPSWTSDQVLFSRRMVRDEVSRTKDNERQKRHRSHGVVTPMSQPSYSSLSSSVSNSNTNTKSLPAKRATQWPENFRINDMLSIYAISRGVEDPAQMWQHFENHHRAKGSRFIDWERAWFTWVANSKRFGGGNGQTGKLSRADERRDRIAARL